VAILILELHHQRPVPPASIHRPTLSYLKKTTKNPILKISLY